MSEFVDYYEILQVHPKADPEVIEKAYKTLIAKHHPDRGGDVRTAQRLNEAFDVLRDPRQRADYNLDWSSCNTSSQGSQADSHSSPPVDDIELWPLSVRPALGDAVKAYDAWATTVHADKGPAKGDTDTKRRFLSSLRVLQTASDGISFPFAELTQSTFPLAADLESVQLIILTNTLGPIPVIGTGQFPVFLDRCYKVAISGRDWKLPDGSCSAGRQTFADQLMLFMHFIARYHPGYCEKYVSSARRAFPNHYDPAVKRLLQIASGPYDEAKWEAWLDQRDSQRTSTVSPANGLPVTAELIHEATVIAGRVANVGGQVVVQAAKGALYVAGMIVLCVLIFLVAVAMILGG